MKPRNLFSREVQYLIEQNIVTPQTLSNLNTIQCNALESHYILEMITNNIITIEQALQFSYDQVTSLNCVHIQGLIANNIITIEQTLQFGYEQRTTLASDHIRALIANNTITIDQALQFGYEQRTSLESDDILGLIDNDTITIEQVLQFGYEQRTSLESDHIRALIANNTITIDQVLQFGHEQRTSLESGHIRALIANNTITIDQVLQFGYEQRTSLECGHIRALIDNNTITIDQVLQFGYEQRASLANHHIRGMIANNTITIEQAMQFGPQQRQTLADPQVRAQLIAGILTFEDIMLGNLNQNVNNAAVNAPNINDNQSTHTASVHQSVSLSATQLENRYQLKDNALLLEGVISDIKYFIQNLPQNSEKNKTAKRCIDRITAYNYTFTDQRSQITTRQLLGLTYLAITDDSNRIGSFEDACLQFIDGLYEIQRGYNLSHTGLDQGGADRSICSAGTFNKLIEKLQGIHPDCEIIFMTSETASLKLPIVVREEAMRYLQSLKKPNNTKELKTLIRLISQIKENGVEVIWDQIKDSIANRMFSEFGELYHGSSDMAFIGLIDAGQYAELPNLEMLQKKIQSSKGYQQFFSISLYQPGLTFSSKPFADYLSDHRQDSPEAQKKYDQHFGLVLRP